MANGNLGNLFGSLTQTLEGIRTTSARSRFFIWEQIPEVINFTAPEGILINSTVTVEPTVVDYIDGPSAVENRRILLGQTLFGNRQDLGWVIRIGAVPVSSATINIPSNESIIEYLIGDADGVYTSPSIPTAGPTRFIFAMYAKVVNTRIENIEQARAALAREDTIQNFTVAQDLYFGNFRVSTNQLLTGINFQRNRNNILPLILYPQNTVPSIPGVESGVFYATTNPDAVNFNYMWFTRNTQQNVNEIRMYESNPNNFPDNPECVPCATGFSCNGTTGICEPDGNGGDTPWYRSTWFYILVGVVGGLIIIGLILGIVFAARKKRNKKKTTTTTTTQATARDPLIQDRDVLVRERETTENKIVLS